MLNKLWMKLKELCNKLINIPSSSPFQDCMLSTFDSLYDLIDTTYCGFPSTQSDVRIINMLLFNDYTDILYFVFKRLYTLHEYKDSSCSIRTVFGNFLLELPDLKLNMSCNESPFKNISYFQTLDELFDYYSKYCFKGEDKDCITLIPEENSLIPLYHILVDSYHNDFLVYKCFNRLTQRKDFFLINLNTGN